MAIKGLVQELIECLSEATECLYRDATGIYNPSRHMAVVAVRGLNLFYSCNMGTRDLPDMHAQSLSPMALGTLIRQITRAHLQLLCNTSGKADSLITNASTFTGQDLFYMHA